MLSGVIKNFTLKGYVFDYAGRLACRALWLLFLLEYKRVRKSTVTNTQLRYCYLFFSWFSENWAHSPKKGLTWNSLLLVFLFQRCCHILWRKLFILSFRSVYGMLYLSGVKSKADFTAASALWFPLTPMRLAIQPKKGQVFYAII